MRFEIASFVREASIRIFLSEIGRHYPQYSYSQEEQRVGVMGSIRLTLIMVECSAEEYPALRAFGVGFTAALNQLRALS